MPTLDLDFGDIGKVPPEGCWRLHINEATYKSNKAKDGFIIELDATFIDMPDDTFEDFKVFPKPTASLKPTARWKLQQILSAITQEDWTADGMHLEVDEDNKVPALANKTVLAICVHDEYNGQTNCKPGTWIPDNGEVTIGAVVSTPGSTTI